MSSDNKLLITRWWVKFRAYNTNYEVPSTHPKFEKIKDLLKNGKTREAITMFKGATTGRAAKKGVVVKGNTVIAAGVELPAGLNELYQKCAGTEAGKHLHKFLVNFAQNPSAPSQLAFARFLSTNNKICITDRGTMLLYKRLRSDYTDCHTGTFDNRPGKTVVMERSRVNPNPNVLCSNGLHVCSHRYLGFFGGVWETAEGARRINTDQPVVVVEVDPRDVVSVPTDHDNAKIRVCRYKVLLDTRDFNRSGFQDFLGAMQHVSIRDIAEMAKTARVKPVEDIAADWRDGASRPTAPTADAPKTKPKAAQPDDAKSKAKKPGMLKRLTSRLKKR